MESGERELGVRFSGTWLEGGGTGLEGSHFRRFEVWSRLGPDRIGIAKSGPEGLVQLVELAPGRDGLWVSLEPHLCGRDRYCAEIRSGRDHGLEITWTAEGPSKHYRSETSLAPHPLLRGFFPG